jgi:hypothetical protein
VHTVCTREETILTSVSAQATQTVTTVDAVLPYLADGTPDAAHAPSGWLVDQGAWAESDVALVGSTCTATETANGGATSTSYACDWTAGATDGSATAGCPGASSARSASPASVTLEGGADIGTLTVTNTFAVAVEPTFTG